MNLSKFIFSEIRKYGDATALIDNSTGIEIKFSQIQPIAEAVASSLYSIGIRKGHVVSIIGVNEPKYVILIYAILRLGAIANLISPLVPDSTQIEQLDASNSKLLLTNIDLGLGRGKHISQRFESLPEGGSEPIPDIEISGDDEALIIWSSGTNGKPAGCVHSHKNILAGLEMLRDNKVKDYMGIRNKDIVAGHIPICVSWGCWLYNFGTILQGACVVLLPTLDLLKLMIMVSKYKITVLHTVLPILHFLAKHPSIEKYLPLTSLREIVHAANRIPKDMISSIKDRFNIELRQMYGMSECGGICFAEYDDPRSYSVGKILPGIVAKLSEQGELYIKGPNIMKRWLDNSSPVVDEQEYFHTGDVLTVESDGTMTIVDRLRDIIKVGGQTVSPSELEHVIKQNEKIFDAAVIGITDERKGEAPKAYVVKNEESLTEQDVIDFVNDKVELYKNVVEVEFIKTIPRHSSGKILRNLLKQLKKEKND